MLWIPAFYSFENCFYIVATFQAQELGHEKNPCHQGNTFHQHVLTLFLLSSQFTEQTTEVEDNNCEY